MSTDGVASHGDPFTDDALTMQFAQLAQNLALASSVGDVLQRVVTVAHHLVPNADLVSITLRSPDQTFHTPVETDAMATELDKIQYDTGEGPCVAAARNPGPAHVYCDDLAAEPSWPTFGPAAAERGIHAVLALALLPDARPPRYSGALNIYSRHPGLLTADAYGTALLLATHASLAIARTTAVARADLVSIRLHEAIDSRDVIGQAKGILMARQGIDADAAFEVLRHASQDLNIKLVDVARLLADRHAEMDIPPR